jgi:hypothetical protein
MSNLFHFFLLVQTMPQKHYYSTKNTHRITLVKKNVSPEDPLYFQDDKSNLYFHEDILISFHIFP